MNLVELQKELEVSAIDRGVENYYDNIRGRKPSELTPERRMISIGMDSMVPVIEENQDRWLSGKPIPRASVWGPYLSGMDSRKIALTALSTMYNTAAPHTNEAKQNSYTHVAFSVGKAIDQLRQFEAIRTTDNKYFHKVLSHSKKMTQCRFDLMRRNFKHPIKTMPLRDKIALGARLVEIAIEHTNMFDYKKIIEHNKTKYIVNLKHDIREQIARLREDHSILLPEYMPMLVEPLPWTNQEDGGYYLIKSTAVKESAGVDNSRLRGLREGRLSPLLSTLNTLQKTQWTIDRENLDILDTLFSTGGGRAGVPDSKRKPYPPKPPDFDESREAKRLWLSEASKINGMNATQAGRTHLVSGQITTAKEMVSLMDKYGTDAIYYPWEACFRYRVYPKHTTLSPQSSDTGRGLLKFTRGVPLGDYGYKWLSIGLSNAIGEDKLSFDDRFQYVHDNERDIKKWVEDPKQYTGWCDADSPFQTLMIAREWVEAQKDKEGFVSHVPIGLDGTCNGLQHFAALGRDRAAAKLTNLLPSDKPQSLYLAIVDAVDEIVDRDCRETPYKNEEGFVNPCHAWKGRIVKEVVKTPIMTTPYGVTSFGMMDQIQSAIQDEKMDGHSGKNIRYMMECIQEAMQEVLFSASSIMDWLKTVSHRFITANKSLSWTSPNGMPVFQEYPNFAQSRIYTAFHCITWRNPDRVNKEFPRSLSKNKNSTPPNFVHNLDATHMMYVMDMAQNLGIEDFRMIHDSFGVHAGHCEEIHPIINRAFYDLHSSPILERFKSECEKTLGEELPPIPDKGDLDMNEVLESLYMFN